MTKCISILGSTGSIGAQTLEVVDQLGLRVAALTARSNVDLMERQARKYLPRLVVLYDENAAQTLRGRLSDQMETEVCSGMEGLLRAAVAEEADTVLTAVVGMVGLQPTLAAIAAGKKIALANKETLVCGGELVMAAAVQKGVEIVPVDSEHSAIFQCLQSCRDRSEVARILLTCSGGTFYGRKKEEIYRATAREALKNPNWDMGAKVTLDSATLMNKGLEVIEAMRLYDLPLDKVCVVVHRQSIIHSMVEYCDGAVLAQLGAPDMRIPIQYALTWPDRLPSPVPELDFAALKHLSFDVADDETFRCLAAAKKAIRKGGLGPCAANGANEEAVRLFLQDKIGFLDIGRLVEGMVDSDSFGGDYTLQDVYDCDRMARDYVKAHV